MSLYVFFQIKELGKYAPEKLTGYFLPHKEFQIYLHPDKYLLSTLVLPSKFGTVFKYYALKLWVTGIK